MVDGEKSPHGDESTGHRKEERRHTVDYGRPMMAEHEARTVVERILKDGGQILWERLLMRKAFPFAMDAAVEAVNASVEMCFVAVDHGEDSMEGWGLEPEPQPASKDAWARMVLKKKEDVKMRTTFNTSKDSGFGVPSKKMRRGKSTKDILEQKPKKEKVEVPRSWAIEEKHQIDKDEEIQRDFKAKYDTKKRDQEKQKKEEAKAAEKKRAEREALHEEMDKRPHTYDLDGNVMWVEPPNLQKLPQVVEMIRHNVKSDKIAPVPDATTRSSLGGVSAPKPKKKTRRRPRKEEPQEFPDTYIPLQHAQPPILETMNMKVGVSLQHKGKSKVGPPSGQIEGKLTRSEYNALAQREISGDTQLQFTASGGVRAYGGNTGRLPIDTTPSPSGGKDTTPTGGSPDKNGRSGDSLPPLDKGRPPPPEGGGASAQASNGLVLAGSGAGVSPGDAGALAGGRDEKTIRSPPAPHIYTRARKFESIGHLGRPPRAHPPSLGKLDVSASPKASPPPLGATMGHGLLRTQSAVEEFFFPPSAFAPEHALGTLMSRSASDPVLTKERGLKLPISSKQSPTNSVQENIDESHRSPHGLVFAEAQSSAYRNVRKQLFPEKEKEQKQHLQSLKEEPESTTPMSQS